MRRTRRHWLGATASLLAVPLLARSEAPTACPVGLQLYSVGTELARDLAGTLQRVRGLGIEQVELADWAGHAPERVIAAVHAAGLRADSLHIPWAALQSDLPTWVAHARALGATQLVVPVPVMPAHGWPPTSREVDIPALVRRLMTPDQWALTAQALADAGRRLADTGLALAYHNHGMEFDRREGQAEIERLLAVAGPAVGWELDVGWAMSVGEDPLAWMARYGTRIHRLHLKEVSSQGARALGDAGATVHWSAVLAAARRAGVRAAYIELEPPFTESPWALIERSLRHLQHGLHLP